jgi:hypothetical protein
MYGDPGNIASCAYVSARDFSDLVLLKEEIRRLSAHGPFFGPSGSLGLKGLAASADAYAKPSSDGQMYDPSNVPTQRESVTDRTYTRAPLQFPALAGAGA